MLEPSTAVPGMTYVAVNATMFELDISARVKWMSLAMTSASSGGKAYLQRDVRKKPMYGGSQMIYQDQKAIKKPNQEKKNTRP